MAEQSAVHSGHGCWVYLELSRSAQAITNDLQAGIYSHRDAETRLCFFSRLSLFCIGTGSVCTRK